MWIPVVDDSAAAAASGTEAPVVEAIVAVVPERVVQAVEFVWLRDDPTDPPPDKAVVAFRIDADVGDRLAALVRDGDGIVLEVYVENVRGGLTDAWLRQEWGVDARGLALSTTEKLEVTIFALLAHFSMRRRLAEEAKTLIQRIGRVIFRAAVRTTLQGLERMYPEMTFGDVSPSIPGEHAARRAPIDDREVAGTDYEHLLHRLLGLTEPNGREPRHD